MQNVYKSGKGGLMAPTKYLVFSCLTYRDEYFSYPCSTKSQSKPLGSEESTTLHMWLLINVLIEILCVGKMNSLLIFHIIDKINKGYL